MGKVIADVQGKVKASDTSATFEVENATSSVNYVLSKTDGSANQILKTDGSGNLSWTNDAAGALVHLHTTTVDAVVSEIAINDVFTSTYSNYRIVLNNIFPDTTTNTIYIAFKETSGSTQLNMHSITRYFGVNSSGATIYGDSSEYDMGGSELFKTATADGGVNGYIDVFNPFLSGAADWTRTIAALNGYNATASGWVYTYAAAQATATTTTPCFRVWAGGGNIGDASVDGFVRVYGYKDS